MADPVDLRDRARPIRLLDLPARIRVADHDPARPFVLTFTVEPYAVPDAGAEILPFSLPARPKAEPLTD